MLEKKDYLEILEGQEVISTRWEGVVGVRDGKFVRAGEIVCADPTVEQLKALSDESFFQEFGTNDVIEILEAEFGEEYPEFFE